MYIYCNELRPFVLAYNPPVPPIMLLPQQLQVFFLFKAHRSYIIMVVVTIIFGLVIAVSNCI
jgi:hypothetical protein